MKRIRLLIIAIIALLLPVISACNNVHKNEIDKNTNQYLEWLNALMIEEVEVWIGGLMGIDKELAPIAVPQGKVVLPDSTGLLFIWFKPAFLERPNANNNYLAPVSTFNLRNIDFDIVKVKVYAFSKKQMPVPSEDEDQFAWLDYRSTDIYIFPDTTYIFERKSGVWRYIGKHKIENLEEFDRLRYNIIMDVK
jgi:hypothetical protein